jgi:LysM repeat protein
MLEVSTKVGDGVECVRKRVSYGLGLILLGVAALLVACGQMPIITPEAASVDGPVNGTSLPTSTPVPGVTATPPPLPPADTATPTVTPTPVIHVVVEGDTLYSIAFDYGVSPDTLQSINGIENPQLLSIGQELIIPTEEETADTTSNLLLPTPTPLPFGVRGIAFYETPVGSLWCLGEVVNTTAVTLTNVQLQVTLYGEDGEPAAGSDAFAAADLIPPGARSPFGVLFTAPPQTWANPQVTVIRGEVAGGLAASYVPISVADVTGQPAESQFLVSGTVQNASGTLAAGYVYVIATAYNADGLVTGFRQERVPLDGPLAPGVPVPFNLLFSFHGGSPADFDVIALGRVPAE